MFTQGLRPSMTGMSQRHGRHSGSRRPPRLALLLAAALGALILLGRSAGPALAAPGDLDPGFGNGGLFSLSGGSNQALEGRGVAIQKDGKVVVAARFRGFDGDENFA